MNADVCAHANDDGFSLPEVLVALALVAILASTMMLGTLQFDRLLKIDNQLNTQMALDSTARHIARLIEDAEDIGLVQQNSETANRYAMRGTRDNLQFFATTRRGARSKGLRQVTLHVEQGTGGNRLLQDLRPRRFQQADDKSDERIELLDKLEEFALTYYGDPTGGSNPAWQSTWDKSTKLPIAVAISVRARSGQAISTANEIAVLGQR